MIERSSTKLSIKLVILINRIWFTLILKKNHYVHGITTICCIRHIYLTTQLEKHLWSSWILILWFVMKFINPNLESFLSAYMNGSHHLQTHYSLKNKKYHKVWQIQWGLKKIKLIHIWNSKDQMFTDRNLWSFSYQCHTSIYRWCRNLKIMSV